MHLHTLRIKNYRRLKDVRIDLEAETSIFVGSNNSGKTSAVEVLKTFFKPRVERFSIYDFSVETWSIFNNIGNEALQLDTPLPTITLDLWFKVAEGDLHRIVKLLPSLDWDNSPVGLRLEYAPKNRDDLLTAFRAANALAAKNVTIDTETDADKKYHPWPETLFDYLKKRLTEVYEIHYFVLDYQKFNDFNQTEGYQPHKLGDSQESGAAVLSSLLRVDCMSAQRHLSDDQRGQGESLSKRLNRFYEKNLEQFNEDFAAVASLVKSENALNDYFDKVFGKTLDSLNKLGYPGFAAPHLVIKSDFEPESLLTKNASVHYALRDPGKELDKSLPVLPDKYNGLGFKNLIYMVVEVLDYHMQWEKEQDNRPPLHVVLVEEPEAHLHVQLQQVFIRKIREILPKEAGDFNTQMIVTTHSPHIIYESGFGPIRYFRRIAPGHYSNVLNLSKFKESEEEAKKFLFQYMKLTHCDLFFADAAVLVEGNVERLLLPLMIESEAEELKSIYLSVIEVGGAFAHLFNDLIHFLGLTTLVITDLDSVQPKLMPVENNVTEQVGNDEVEEGDDLEIIIENAEGKSTTKKAKVCPTWEDKAETSNYTLRHWLPRLTEVSALLGANDKLKCHEPTLEAPAKIRVAYQTTQEVKWKGKTATLAGRTFEEAFAFQNLEWCQDKNQRQLRLCVKQGDNPTLKQVAQRVHDKVKGSGFKKTEFALALMIADSKWQVPFYIAEGLQWLKEEMSVADTEKPIAEEGQ